MTPPTSSAAPSGAVAPVSPAGAARARPVWEALPPVGGTGPHPGEEVRGLLARRLRRLAPALVAVLVFYFVRNVSAGLGLPAARFGLLLQLVVLALMTACTARLYGGRRMSLTTLRVLELVLFGLAAMYLAWLECHTLFEAWDLRAATPAQEAAVLRMALGAAAARWLLLTVAYGVIIPNTPRRAAVVVAALVLVPLLIAAGAGLGHPAAGGSFVLAALPMTASLVAGGAAALFACARLSTYPPQALEGEMIGQYHLKGPLRAGGMGEVYLAEHILLRRPCALKLIRPPAARDPAVRRRFEREARAMATLRHVNAVAVHDGGRAPDGTLYYVMDYLTGPSLEELVARDGPLPPGRVVYLLLQLCDVLGEAHRLGLLHLDVKPGNVLVCESDGAHDVVKLLDFGLAREVGSDEEGGVGSPQYMAPEQAEERPGLDARTDVYGLGGLAYFLLTGRPPFDSGSALELVLAHACDPVTPPSRLRPGVPADLEAVVMRCLEKAPGPRFVNTADLAQALRRCACAGEWDADKAAAAWRRSGDAATAFQGG